MNRWDRVAERSIERRIEPRVRPLTTNGGLLGTLAPCSDVRDRAAGFWVELSGDAGWFR